jgi:choline dehydrogenase
MRFLQVVGQLAAFTSLATAVDLKGYEYVVVGSGAGGGYVYH